MDRDNVREQEKLYRFLSGIMTILYGVACTYLYYRQTKWTGGSVFESDLPAHIRMVIEDGWYYSLTALIYKLLYLLPFHDMAIAVFLGAVSAVTVPLTGTLLIKLGASGKTVPYLALILNLVMPVYIKGLSDGRYMGMQSASIWHNSTYIVMKPLAILCFLLYLELEEKIAQGLSVKSAVVFSVLLAVTTAVKPSFLVVFAPVMLVYLVLDLIGKVPFWRLFAFGCCVLPSLVVILLQNAVLFGPTSDSSVILAPGAVVSQHSAHPLVAAGLSILFPLWILVLHIRDLKRDRIYQMIWLMAVAGYGELFLFSESGHRAMDGNFMWGYYLVILLLFAVSVAKLMHYGQEELPNGTSEEPVKVQKASTGKRMMALLGWILLALHFYFGFYFFLQLLQGVSYMMWAVNTWRGITRA